MSYTSGFFDAVDLGGGNYDREYSADVFAHYFSLLVKNGVFPDPSTGMQVKASTNPDMHVTVQPGSGWINGYYITVPDDAPEVLTVPTANPSLSRIDSVIMGLNYVEREIQLYIKSGAVSASPSAVSLQRDNDLYEMELAQITVAAGVASISQANITDMRQNTSRCGIVKGTIDQIDTTDLFAQYNDAFQTWFADIQVQLSGDVATNLQNQINTLKTGKVNVSDKASTAQAQAGTDDTKWMTPALVKSLLDAFKASTVEAQAGTIDTKWMSPKKTSEAISSIVPFLSDLLSTETKGLYGFSADTVPDTVFQRLLFPAGSYGFKVTINLSNGAANGFELPSDFINLDGSSGVVTDSNGVAYCFAKNKSFTTTFGTGYFGIVPKAVTCTADTTKAFTPITVTLSNDSSLTSTTLIESSTTYKLAGNISDADFCAVGGGGGGRANQYTYDGQGGGGGYVTNDMNRSLSGKKALSIEVGAGGSRNSTGGTTTVKLDGTTIANAAGGQNGTGNGNGGRNGKAGGDGTVRVFNDSSLPLPGGGGGCGNAAGGKDFGGHGAWYGGGGSGITGGGTSGTGPGGGGGGMDYGTMVSGGDQSQPGHKGGVYVRVRYK